MDTAALAELKKNFAEWSGGFPPASADQITVYIDYTLPQGVDPIAARRALIEWLEQEAISAQRRGPATA